MPKYLCNKGFLLTPSPSDEDVMVPFFVQVRDKDIIWSEDDFPKEIYNIAMGGDNPSTVTPVKALKFIQDGWNITFNQDYTYTAYKQISIGGSGNFEINDQLDCLNGKIYLPFKSKAGGQNISIICTLDAFDNIMASSVLTTSTHATTNIINSFSLYITNMNGVLYPKKFEFNESINKSYVNVMVHGKYIS